MKIIQILKDGNSLIGLDDKGKLHRYDFDLKKWIEL